MERRSKKDSSTIGRKMAFIYVRVSSKEQEREGYSIPAQIKLLREYSAQHGLEVAQEFVDVETAKRTGRTFFSQMVSLLKRERQKTPSSPRIILVEKTDRLYRNIRDWVTIDDLDAEIHFVKENVILSSDSRSSEKFMHGIKVLMAKNYLDNLSEETSKGMLEKARQGIYPSCAPFGYANIVDSSGRKVIALHPVNGPLVALVYEWYASGEYSLADICTRLKVEHAEALAGKPLTRGFIHQMLTSEIYYGDFVWNGEHYRGTHEPLVSKKQYEAVQDVLRSNGKRHAPQQHHKFAFQGLVHCGFCGCAMVAERKKGKYIYYHCTQNKGRCPGKKSVPEAELDRQFIESLEAIQMPAEAVEFVQRALKESHRDKQVFHHQALTSLQEDLERIRGRMDAMYIDKLDGKVTQEYYERKRREWQRDAEKIQEKMLKHRNADDCYMDEGVKLLELVQHAVNTYKTQESLAKGVFLNFVHSNSNWKDGKLTTEYRQPFDFIAKTNTEYARKMAVSPEKNGHCLIWLPNPDSNQGHGD